MPSSKLHARKRSPRKPACTRACPPPPPTGDCSCELIPDVMYLETSDPEYFTPYACCTNLPLHENVAVTWDVTGGEVEAQEAYANCDDAGVALYYPPDEDGTYYVVATFTFSDSTQCQATMTVHLDTGGGPA